MERNYEKDKIKDNTVSANSAFLFWYFVESVLEHLC